jgi:hypothetical protein
MAVVRNELNEKRSGESPEVFRRQNEFRQNAHTFDFDALIATRSRTFSSIAPSFAWFLNSTYILNRSGDCLLRSARVVMAFSFVLVWARFAFTTTETNHDSGL